MPPSRPEWIRGVEDETWAEYVMRARHNFFVHERGLMTQIRNIYRRAAEDVAKDLRRLKLTSQARYMERVAWWEANGYSRREALERAEPVLTDKAMRTLQEALHQAAENLNRNTLDAVRMGHMYGAQTGSQAARMITESVITGLDYGHGRITAADVGRLFSHVNQKAVLAQATRNYGDGMYLSDRIWRTAQRSRTAMMRVVQDGIARGMSAKELARRVTQYMNEEIGKGTTLSPRVRRALGIPKSISMEAMRLAVTEMGNAFHEANVLSYQVTPGCRGAYWRLSEARHEVPDICDEYATAGPDKDGFWPLDEIPIKPHPWCYCVIVPALQSRDELIEDLRAWIRNPSSRPELEAWYNGDPRAFFPRPRVEVRPPDPDWKKPIEVTSFAAREAVENQRRLESYFRDHNTNVPERDIRAIAADKILDEMGVDEDYVRLVDKLREEFTTISEDEGSERRAAEAMIGKWASTSGDSDSLAVAIQIAAREEFGLEQATVWWADDVVAEARERWYDEHGGALRKFLRAQYNVTQRELAEEGIDYVYVVRGASWEQSKLPTELKDIPMDGEGRRQTLQTQPLSSFSANPDMARSFAVREDVSMMVAAKVPRERVLGTVHTGFGTRYEQEVVILGGIDEYVTVTWNRKTATEKQITSLNVGQFWDIAETGSKRRK